MKPADPSLRRCHWQAALFASAVAAALLLTGCASARRAAALTRGWVQKPFTYTIQYPYDLKPADRYQYDQKRNIHDFWINYTDKPHLPPPNRTTARTEMRLENFNSGEHMFDADVNVSPGTFACIAQVFDDKHGPVLMLVAHPDGKITVGPQSVIGTNVLGRWWNLKITNDPVPDGRIRIYINNLPAGTYRNRGSRDYYFKCGVYSRKGSARSEARFRNIRVWVKKQEVAAGQ